MKAFGVKSGLFINGEEVFAGPMTEDEIRDKIAAAIKRSDDDYCWYD